MTSDEFKRKRLELGLSLQEMGLALGYSPHNKNTRSVMIRSFESGRRAIPESTAEKVMKLTLDALK